MNWLTNLFSGGISDLLKAGGDLVDRFVHTDSEKAQMKLALEKLITERLALTQEQVGRETEAKMQVLTAELKQGDNFTKRARPTVVYAGLGFIAINHVVFPVTGRVLMAFFPEIVFDTSPLPDLPSEFWLAWGGICAVWAIGRTREKIRMKGEL